MLNREGVLAAILAVGLIFAGRMLGTIELFLLGAALGSLLVLCGLRVGLSRLDLGVNRLVMPSRVHAGNPARVELRLLNNGSRRTPVLAVSDQVSGTKGAKLLVGPLESGGSARAAYQLPTHRRGLLTVGPLDVLVTDPFGLATSRSRAVGATTLVIYPHIDQVAPLPMASGQDPQALSRQPNALGRAGDDFYALRNYVIGDDMRRVHWPATAHHGELMIRQHELPWQERTTVLLDNRSFATTPAGFEIAVSAAASVLTACGNGGDQIRLVVASGPDSGFGTGRIHLDHLLVQLASVQLDPHASLQRSLAGLDKAGIGGSLALIVADDALTDLQRVSGLRQRFGRVVTVVIDSSASQDPARTTVVSSAATPVATGAMTVRVTSEEPFAEAWNRLFGRARQQQAAAVAAVDALT